MFELEHVSKDWTLFLDRDGVINHEKNNDYILHKDEFRFYDGVVTALASLRPFFKYMLIATNQRGIGKGVMQLEDLEDIHQHMITQIEQAGGSIDKIYFCIDLSDDSPNRKPNPGMAFQAQQDFPDIDLSKSIMVGNRPSDMKFGRNAGMHTVFVATTHPEVAFPHTDIDLRFKDLPAFAEAIAHVQGLQ
jgi:D-glycero-D-manno-heptose 1,7-bisphosphate phosphatase